MTPRHFGHYRLDAQIGQGGMGEVFRAFDTRLNRPVAVKVMRAKEGARSIRRFLQEARAASALNHPNIVVIHEVGETEAGEYYIVQEFIAGSTLRSLLAEPLPLGKIANVGAQIARALAAAHAAGIVHRDVKPENIMVRDDGYVKVLDFGLADMTDHLETTDQPTYTSPDPPSGSVQGTPSYMAPEQASGRRASAASDVFALGVVLYEMASGRRPFVAPTSLGIIASIISEEAPPLARVNPAVPPMLADLVHCMLAKDPRSRPSAHDVEMHLSTVGGDGVGLAVIAPRTERTTVGYEAQRAQLHRAYARVAGGHSLIAAVTGEPGIGKTSLLEDFLSDLKAGGTRPVLARGRCSERLAGAEAYLPVLEALESLLRRSDGPSLDSVMQAVAPTWYEQVAMRSPDSGTRQPSGDRAAASQERMKRELGALAQELSRQQPLVVVIEDLHWADVSSIDMLNYMASRFSDMRMLVLTSYRPSDMALVQHPFLGIRPTLQARGAFEEVNLRFIEVADVERYLALQFPDHGFPAGFAAHVHAKTEGSPLFMVDLLRYLRDTGGIQQEGGRWVLTRSLGDAPADLPESVRGMIAAKIERLDEADRRLLVAASVQGTEFDSVIVGQALEMDPADVEDRLEVLERVHVLVKRGSEFEFPDLTLTLKYRFVHALYQNVLYASLSPSRRTSLSGKVARALADHHGDKVLNVAGRLAVLFEAAREFAPSAMHFYTAAQHAIGLFAFREALALADRGLTVLRGVPDGPARKQQELGLQMVKGLALRSSEGWATPELEAAFARARQICQELEDPPELIPVLWATTLFHLIRGNLAECRERADALRAQAQASGNPAFEMAAHHIAGVCREFIGEMPESSRLLERCRELHDPAQHAVYTKMYGLDPGMLARAMSSRPLWMLGYPDRAAARARETLAIARTQRQPMTLAFALVVMQGIHMVRGEAAEALAMGDEIIALCREHEQPQEVEWCRSFQGGALALLGRTSEAIEVLSDSLRVQQSIGSGLVRPAFLALLADALGQVGRIDEGLRAIDEGFAHAERTMEGGPVAELHRVRGTLLLPRGDRGGAEAGFRAAVDYAQRQQTRSFELRAATALARLMAADGRRDAALEVLSPVYGWFTEGRDTADLIAARNLLNEIGTP